MKEATGNTIPVDKGNEERMLSAWFAPKKDEAFVIETSSRCWDSKKFIYQLFARTSAKGRSPSNQPAPFCNFPPMNGSRGAIR